MDSGHPNYNVFLSCGGEDTCKTFTDHLYLALAQAGVHTFNHHHHRQLPLGQNLYSVLRKAVRESKVSVVVFSKEYASSELCLDELVEIIKCKEMLGQLVIIPVFYNVGSDDVRDQSGAFAEAFARHEACYVDETVKVEQWRSALREASKLPGWDLQDFANGGGLPLALEVLGASLLGQTKKELWQSTLEKLRKISPNRITEKLRISFETLDDDTIKDIFLDIACFFIGMDKDYVTDIFIGCGFFPSVGIRVLIDRCLLKVCWRNKLRMHDLVRDMGRKIVNEKFPYEPEKRSRIWSQKDVINVLKRYKGSPAIEGLTLDLSRPMHLSTKAFKKMHRLRLLKINNVHLDGNFEGLFQELRWLCWHHCPLDCLPDEFHPEKLICLDMQHNSFNKLWQGTKFLGNLKILNISESESLTTTPDFAGVPNLEKLSLVSCPKLSYVDKTIGFLSKLTSLNLGRCNNLKNLPSSICNLRSLQILSLYLSSKMEQLPEKLGDMKQLRDIDLTGTAIKELPDSIGNLSNLNSLFLSSCKNFTGLPNSICNLGSLECLYMNGCSNLLSLPEDMGNIKCLRVLSAIGTAVKCLPGSIGLLGELAHLSLDDCKNLTSLPDSICNLISLEKFNLGYCPRIELGESAQTWDNSLINLTRLNLRGCNLYDKDIPHNLGAFSFLDDLVLGKNNFCSLPASLGRLSNVLSLDLCGCRNLKSVQVFPPNLNWLMLKDCSSLEKLTLSTLISLSSINLKNCSSLVEILGLENLYLITEIHLEGCSSLSTAFTTSLIQVLFVYLCMCTFY